MFYENLQNACAKNNTTPTALVKKLQLSSGNVTNWKKGKIPNGDIIIQFSEHLNVSCDYLLIGRENNSSLTEREELLIKLYRDCNDKGRNYIMESADMAKDKYKKDITVSNMENKVG